MKLKSAPAVACCPPAAAEADSIFVICVSVWVEMAAGCSYAYLDRERVKRWRVMDGSSEAERWNAVRKL